MPHRSEESCLCGSSIRPAERGQCTARSKTAALAALVLAGAIACFDPVSPVDQLDYSPNAPAMETVPLNLLGPGKVVFRRLWRLSQIAADNPVHIYAIGAGSQSLLVRQNAASQRFAYVLSPTGESIALVRQHQGFPLHDLLVRPLMSSTEHVVSTRGISVASLVWNDHGDSLITREFRIGLVRLLRMPVKGFVAPDTISRLDFLFLLGGTLPLGGCPMPMGDRDDIAPSPVGTFVTTCAHNKAIYTSDGNLGSPRQHFFAARVDSVGSVLRYYSPAWNSSGTRVAFVEQEQDTTAGIISRIAVRILDPATGVTTTLQEFHDVLPAKGFEFVRHLCWLAGDQGIVFTKPDRDPYDLARSSSHIYVTGANGGGLTQLTTATGVNDTELSCSR